MLFCYFLHFLKIKLLMILNLFEYLYFFPSMWLLLMCCFVEDRRFSKAHASRYIWGLTRWALGLMLLRSICVPAERDEFKGWKDTTMWSLFTFLPEMNSVLEAAVSGYTFSFRISRTVRIPSKIRFFGCYTIYLSVWKRKHT